MEQRSKELRSTPQRSLRIAMLGSRGFPHTYSGYEVFINEIAPRLAARGHEVLVYCRSSLFPDRPKTYKGVRLIYLPSIETKTMGTLTHTLVSMLDVLFRRMDVIFVVNLVNSFHLNAKFVGRICPTGVITDAQEMRRIYLDEFRTPSACIAYGANIAKSCDPSVVRRYGLEPFQYYLILSRMVPENNADLILREFTQLRTSRVLAIAGDANYRSEFVDRLKQTSDPRVRFIGHIGDPDHVKELHCNAYAYLHGHSLGGTNPSLLTALGSGNCVLALNTPFNAEVLQDYGILFERDPLDLAAKLQHIEDHPEVAAEYRTRAPTRIREAYTWDKITDQYEEFFRQLAAGKDSTQIHSHSIPASTVPPDREEVPSVLAVSANMEAEVSRDNLTQH